MLSTILLVDDEPNITHALKRILRKEPFEVLTASSGAKALEILQRHPVDVVVSDEQMPGMSGSELLAIVCQKHPDTMRIILTGQARLDAAIKAINEGQVFRFLLKPCNQYDLSLTIRQAIQHRRLLIESRRLLAAARQQSKILGNLEKDNPGITTICTDDDGAIVLDDDIDTIDVDSLVRKMNEEVMLCQKLTLADSER